MTKDFYTVKEFAKKVEYSTDRVYEWLRSGRIKHSKRMTPHSTYRIPKIEVTRIKGLPKSENHEGNRAIRERLGRFLDEGHALSDSEVLLTPSQLRSKMNLWDDKVSRYIKAKLGIVDLALYQDAKGLTPRFSFTEPDPDGKKTILTYLWARIERLHQLIDRLSNKE